MYSLRRYLNVEPRITNIQRPPSWINAPKVKPYKSRHSTIGHTVLDEDKRAEQFPDSIYRRLESVVDEVAKASIPILDNSIDEARQTLTAIEDVVKTSNFVCSIPYYLVHSFSDGLFQKPLDQRLIGTPENSIRDKHLRNHLNDLFSHVDCDLGTLLYLSVGEVIGIPLCMVEVPDHNFIRWRLRNGQYLNWDTNYGFDKFSDSEYADRYGVTADEKKHGVYLADMTVENTLGYFCFVRGLTLQRQKRLREAVNEYRSGISKYPKSPSSRNNLAWQFVSERSVQTFVSGSEAQKASEEACSLSRSHNNLDTLACVYAENGDFDLAIKTEKEAYSLSPHPSYLKMIHAFKAGKTWLDVNENTV